MQAWRAYEGHTLCVWSPDIYDMCFVHFAKSNFPPKNDPLNIAHKYFGLNATDEEERNMTCKVVSNNICLFF